ncbi:MAG: adenylate/guanylate cyclase domain-containing protein, partial [Cyanobacteria bacterium]|nr:adenylate/guanylate cyclase domain-containing protein [Cyanobacteriota bacterium]
DSFSSPEVKQMVRVYPRYSFLNVIKSQVFYECQADPQQKICSLMHFKNFIPLDPLVFKDHYVMFGMNSISYDMDNHSTLYDKNGRKYPGIYIQTNILDNILHNDFIGRPGWRVPLPRPLATLFPAFETVSLVTIFTCLLMMLMTLRLNQWSSISLSVFSVVMMGISYNFLCHYAYEQWNLWLNWVYPMTTLVLSYSIGFVIRYVQTEKKKNQLRIAFGKYFPKDIMDSIIKNPDKFVRGQRLTMTFLFSDIRGFTWFAEHNDTELVQKTLNNYYTTLHQITLETKGTAFKFLGDGVLAFWGFPVQTAEDPIHAIHAALAMKQAVEAWGDDPAYPTIKIGIGINTGEAFFGNVGSDQYMDFTVIGDNVNIASRLQDLN